MKIGIEAQRIFRKKRFGMDIVAIELIANLQKIDNENEYFIFVKPDENREGVELWNKNFQFVEIESFSYVDWEQAKLPTLAAKLELDLLHCTNNTAPMLCKIPLVLTLHDTIFIDKIDILNPKIPLYQSWGNFYRKIIVSRTINRIKHIITVSDFERNLMIQKFGLDPNSISTIYNGVGENFFDEITAKQANDFKQKYSVSGKYLLFLGNMHPRKNMANVVKAFLEWKQSSNRPEKLLITNISKDDLLRACNLKNEDFNGLILTGYIDRDELPIVISQAELLLYPSIREGFGIPIIEGFACKVPVITSSTSSMPEVAGSAAILVDPHNYEEISIAIDRLMTDEKLRADLIANGYERAKQFSWENTARKYLEIYKRI